MLAQHLRHHHLGEEHLVDLVQKLPRHLEFELGRLLKLDPDHQAFATHFFDERMLVSQHVDLRHQERTHFRRIFDKVLVVYHLERGEPARHRKVVTTECRRMNNAAIHARKSFLINFAPRHDRAARDVTATQCFRQSDDVRLEVPMLKAEHFSGATESGLHFIGDEQRSVRST